MSTTFVDLEVAVADWGRSRQSDVRRSGKLSFTETSPVQRRFRNWVRLRGIEGCFGSDVLGRIEGDNGAVEGLRMVVKMGMGFEGYVMQDRSRPRTPSSLQHSIFRTLGLALRVFPTL